MIFCQVVNQIKVENSAGAPVAQWVKRWPVNLAVPGSQTGIHRIKLNVITLTTSSRYDINNVKKDVKSRHSSVQDNNMYALC